MKALEFGFFPRPLDFVSGDILIESLPNLRQTADELLASTDVMGSWIYAPMDTTYVQGALVDAPFTARIFSLPKTHSITHQRPDSDAHLKFHVWALSFFVDMRLTTTDAGFLDATPIRPGLLTDFLLLNAEAEAVELAELFWSSNRAEPRNALRWIGAVNALYLSKRPTLLQFEAFQLLYVALDAAFALAKNLRRPGKLGHAERILWMCNEFQIPVPSWAAKINGRVELAALRNDSFHEALFLEEPLGYAVYGVGSGRNLKLEMAELVCRLLVALIGAPDNDYVRSPVTIYQRQGLRLA